MCCDEAIGTGQNGFHQPISFQDSATKVALKSRWPLQNTYARPFIFVYSRPKGVRMSTPSVQIPSPVASFEIRCSVAQYIMDSDDPGKAPDLIAVGGRVEITPNLKKPLRVFTDPPRVVSHETLIFTIDPETGQLVHPDGTIGVSLIDPNDENLDPTLWTYTARVIPARGQSWSVTFGGPPEGSSIVDLTMLVSTDPSGGTPNPMPVFTWNGTRLVINGVEGPDLAYHPE